MRIESGEPEAPRKGTGDAIVTYGTVSALYNMLTRLDANFEAFRVTQEERKEVQEAHGIALRAQETRLIILETRSDSSRKFLNETWAVLIAILSLAVSAVSGASSVIWHVR